jgi:hypothetical protein
MKNEASQSGVTESAADKKQDVIVVVVLASISLVIGFIFFLVIGSTAEGEVLGVQVSGGIAGFVVVFALLFNSYKQSQSSSEFVRDLQRRLEAKDQELNRKRELEKLQEQNSELQAKLIRGAPCPLGFSIEVAERERIVFARPDVWSPRGGQIVDLMEPYKPSDNRGIPARFRCTYRHIFKKTKRANLFEEFRQDWLAEFEAPTIETVRLGGDPSQVEALKLIGRQYYRVEQFDSAKVPVGYEPETELVPRWEFLGGLNEVRPNMIHATGDSQEPTNIVLVGEGFGSDSKFYAFRVEDDFDMNYLEEGTELEALDKSRRAVGVSLPPQLTENAGSLQIVLDNCSRTQSDISERAVILNVVAREHAIGEGQMQSETFLLEEKVFEYVRVFYSQVVCYAENLKLRGGKDDHGTLFMFHYFDDEHDFSDSSMVFNQILNSIRFLE